MCPYCVLNNARDDDQGAVRCMHNLMNVGTDYKFSRFWQVCLY